jgi:hypothetical protein
MPSTLQVFWNRGRWSILLINVTSIYQRDAALCLKPMTVGRSHQPAADLVPVTRVPRAEHAVIGAAKVSFKAIR